MKVIITGATGMVGKGVLHTCLQRDDVSEVIVITRSSSGLQHPKMVEFVTPDVTNLAPWREHLLNADACLFCLGTSSMGTNEGQYWQVTYELTMKFARNLAEINRDLTFCYVSGSGSEAGSKVMWKRVKASAENALMTLPFTAIYIFRPAYIHPQFGVRSNTAWINLMLVLVKPMYPLLKRLIPNYVTHSRQIANSMLQVTTEGFTHTVLEAADIRHFPA